MAAPEGYTKLGNVGYADKGVYSAEATYNKYNTVYHEGSTYVALKDNLHGVTPADGVNWRYMAKGFTEASADAITVIDTSGIIDGTKNKKTILQTFLDKVGDFIINKAVTNDVLMLKLADYLKKTDIVQTESTATNKVPSSAYLKQVVDAQNSNLEWKLNGTYKATDTCPLPEKYNELMIKIYRTSDYAYTCGVNILKAEIGKNTGNWMTGCGRDANGWDVKIVIAITNTIAINSVFINAADNKSNFSFVVYYR